MKKPSVEICPAEFDGYKCCLPLGHKAMGGKHRAEVSPDGQGCWVCWTEAGKERILREREANRAARETKQ